MSAEVLLSAYRPQQHLYAFSIPARGNPIIAQEARRNVSRHVVGATPLHLVTLLLELASVYGFGVLESLCSRLSPPLQNRTAQTRAFSYTINNA